MLTNSELNQIKNFLALYGKKDSQLSLVTSVDNADYVALVHGGKNVRITVELLQKAMLAGFVDPDNPAFSSLWDNVPQEDSSNPVRSSGIWHAINDNDVINTNQIKNNAVTSAKIKNGEVKTNNIADKNVTEAKLSDDINNAISKYAHTLSITGKSLREIGSLDSSDILESTFSTTHRITYFGDRSAQSVTPSSQNTSSNVGQDTISGNTWTLAPTVGNHILSHTSTYNGVTPSNVSATIALNLRKYFGFVPDNIIMQGNTIILKYLMDNKDTVTNSQFSNSVGCTVDIKANGTGKKYVYFAVPVGMPISLVTQTASQLEFQLNTPISMENIYVLQGRSYTYLLYKSVEKPDSDRAKNVRIS